LVAHLELDDVLFAEGAKVVLIKPDFDAVRVEDVRLAARHVYQIVHLFELRKANWTAIFLLHLPRDFLILLHFAVGVNFEFYGDLVEFLVVEKHPLQNFLTENIHHHHICSSEDGQKGEDYEDYTDEGQVPIILEALFGIVSPSQNNPG